MKTIHSLLGFSLGLFVCLPAFANWSAPLTDEEVIFGCDGTTPSYSAGFALNVATSHGEIRMPDGSFSFENHQILVSDQKTKTSVAVGKLSAPATCSVEDTGEPATPSWNAITLNANLKAALSFATDLTSCVYDTENDVFTRVNHYTLTVNTANGTAAVYAWDVDGTYASPDACSTLDQ